ncbi:MAG: ABC transporter substrate-binding protein [Oscillospiraceae bacterium]
MKKIICLIFAVLLVLPITACMKKTPNGTPDFPVTVGGTTLNKAPSKIAVLSPGIYAVMKKLDISATVVAVDEYTISEELTTVGTAQTPDITTIDGLSCDLVLTNTALPAAAVEALKSKEIAVAVIPAPIKYEDLKKYYEDIAAIACGNVAAFDIMEQKFTAFEAELSAVCNGEQNGQTAVLMLTPTIAAPRDTIGDKALYFGGFTNAAASSENGEITAEKLKELNPDVIFCDAISMEIIKGNAALAELSSIKNGKVFPVSVMQMELLADGILNMAMDMKNCGQPPVEPQ